MSVLKLIRYLRGYVWFEARGPFVERFLNLAARNRIPVWGGGKRGGIYTGCVIAGDYRRLRAFAGKTNTRLRVTEKHGAPFRRHQYRRRTGLLVGLGVFLAFLFGMSQFIWRIEVNGNDSMADAEILDALDRLGVSQGTLRAAIDVRDVERRALLELPDLSWFALNVDGSAIYVEVSERVPPPEMVDPRSPCNVVAGEAGQILSMNVYDGQTMVRIGDTVLPGDIIVSGITQDGRGQSLFRHAMAEVIAQVQYDVELAVPLDQTEYRETGKVSKRGYLSLLGWELPVFLPFKIPLPYHVERTETPLVLFSQEMPISWLGEEYYLMEEIPVTYTGEEAKRMAIEELLLVEKAALADAEILDKKVTGQLESGEYRLRATYVCNMDIAVQKKIAVGE